MQISHISICKLPRYSHTFLDNIRETKENVIGHGSLTPSVLSPTGACGFVYPSAILVMTSEHYPHSKVCV